MFAIFFYKKRKKKNVEKRQSQLLSCFEYQSKKDHLLKILCVKEIVFGDFSKKTNIFRISNKIACVASQTTNSKM